MKKLDVNKQYAFEKFVRSIMDCYEAPGMAISIIDEEGVLYRSFFGYRDKENGLLIDENTIFGLASITKSFTCLAIMQMAGEGKMDIHKTVANCVPECTAKNVCVEQCMASW